MSRSTRRLSPCVLFLLVSCVHQLQVVNIEDFDVAPSDGPRRSIAIIPATRTDENSESDPRAKDRERLERHVITALRRHPAVSEVRTSWTWNDGATFTPDAVIALRPRVEFGGSGWNFPLTFPGFLFFLPAGHGFVYTATVDTDVDIFDARTRSPSNTISVPTDFDLRHCDFGRSFWAESGWWTPGWGATSLLSAFYMISYDEDATTPFHAAVRDAYGDFVAEQVIRSLDAPASRPDLTVR